MDAQPVSTSGSIPPDVLLSHAGSIRALALSILGNAQAADDVLQETWVRALRRPPRTHESVGGWLRKVAEGIALSRLRSEGRRRRREARWAEERGDATAEYDGGERAEVLRAVVDEVLALEEPYRETILRRFFEDLPPREIAALSGATVATVNSRLQRGQARLRERLERRLGEKRGGMRGALIALVGWRGAGAGRGVAPALQFGAAAACVALAILAAELASGSGRAPSGGAELAQRGSEAPVELAGAGAASERRALALAPPAPAAAPAAESVEPGPYAFDVEIEPLDPRGRPLAQCDVWIGADTGTLAPAGRTGWDGRLRLAWRGFEPERALVVRAGRAQRGSTALRRVRVRAGGPVSVRVALERAPPGEAEPTTLASLPVLSFLDSGRPVRAQAQFGLDAGGNGVFLEPWQPAPARPLTSALVVDPLDGLAPDEESGGGMLELRALDEQGRPLEHAWFSVCSPVGGYREDIDSGPSGATFALGLHAGTLLVSASRPGIPHPLAVQRIELGPRERRALTLTLPREPLALVRLAAPDGVARADWVYELRDARGSTVGRGAFDVQGRGAIPLGDGGACTLLARQGALGPAVVVAEGLYAASREQVFAAPPEPRTRTLLVLVRGERAESCIVRVERLDSGDALHAPSAAAEEQPGEGAHAFRARGLPSGTYRVRVATPAGAWIDGGRVELGPGRGPERVLVEL